MLYFNLESEEFNFYVPLKMKHDPLWIDITRLMQKGPGPLIPALSHHLEYPDKLNLYLNRLSAITNIREIDLHVEEITGQDKTIDVVVEIFNKLTSSPPLTKGIPTAAYAASVGSCPETAQGRRLGFCLEDEEEERLILACNTWVEEQGLPEGLYEYELADPDSGEPLAILDLAWPDGLQPGLSEPVALLIAESLETLNVAQGAGFRCFTEVAALRRYVQREVLAVVDTETGIGL